MLIPVWLLVFVLSQIPLINIAYEVTT